MAMSQVVFDVREFGAVGDGVALDTAAVQRAIDQAGERGGRVVMPTGTYRCGTIFLRSRVTLEIAQGAVLLGSNDLGDYQAMHWGHHNDITPWHLLAAEDCENIVVTGEGAIDGQGMAFWHPERPNDWSFWKAREHRVSPMVELVRCRNVRVENVTLRNSAGWTLHLHDCDTTRIRGITIRNTPYGPNCDGIDLTGCHDACVSDCDIDTADDAIALKTSEYSRSCEDIVITNCVLRTSCVGVRLGFESRQDFRRIAVTNITVPRCSRVIDLRSIEGAVIEHVTISNVVGVTDSGWPVNRPIEMVLASVPNVYKHMLVPEHPDYRKDKPMLKKGAIRHITLRDVDIITDGRVLMCADPDLEMRDIVLSNVRLKYAVLDDPAPFDKAGSVSFLPGPGVAEARTVRAAIVALNAKDVVIEGLKVEWPVFPVPAEWKLLKTPHRMMSPFLAGHEAAVASGERRVTFPVLWGKNLTGRGDLARLKGSEGGPAAELTASDFEIVG